ncbi:MAG: ATP-binding cassette domain-containing protein [Opitutus sp.]|nr:ATP-binding cassette domain-containing protein [Opitutus sp.]
MSAANELLLDVRGVRKVFGDQVVLDSVDLQVRRGTIVTILGKSGTGKSVLLKCVAGILRPDAGEIRFDDHVLDAANATARAEFRRRCSYLFQSNALFDSLTALENVGLPLEQTTKLSDREVRERARAALARLDLEKFADRYPGQMSGGMQKRLALARAIVTHPELVLFDEPTAGLDPIRRNSVFEMIVRYQREFDFTALVVTHDVPEALAASDQVALLDGGRVRFAGAPAEFARSTDSFVTTFRDSAAALTASLAALRSGATANSESLA